MFSFIDLLELEQRRDQLEDSDRYTMSDFIQQLNVFAVKFEQNNQCYKYFQYKVVMKKHEEKNILTVRIHRR